MGGQGRGQIGTALLCQVTVIQPGRNIMIHLNITHQSSITPPHTQGYKHTNRHTNSQGYTYTLINTHTQGHKHQHTHTNSGIHTHRHTYTLTHSRRHTHTHPHTHAHTNGRA